MKHFRERGTGTLINIASVIGKIPAPYYAAKAAIGNQLLRGVQSQYHLQHRLNRTVHLSRHADRSVGAEFDHDHGRLTICVRPTLVGQDFIWVETSAELNRARLDPESADCWLDGLAYSSPQSSARLRPL